MSDVKRKIRKNKKYGIFGSIVGSIVTFFGFLGITGLCCLPIVVAFLGIFGLTSAIIMNNAYLFLISAFLIFLSILIYYKLKK
ncbi:MAG: hypothetical protein ACE5J4_01390 [Candidatus Aenigmatarchaeota archaeon]